MAEKKNINTTTTAGKKKNTSLKRSILVKKIMLSIVIATVIIAVPLFYIHVVFRQLIKSNIDFLVYDKKISDINREEKELERKDALTRVYIDIWKNEITDEQKSLTGIDMEKIRTIITKLGDDNYLMDLSVSLSFDIAELIVIF